MLSAGISFVVFLLITRYVSLSSLLAGLVFATVHFRQFPDFWGGDHIAMSLATIGLLVLLLVRHRKNLARIHAGTEPKVSFRKKTATSSSGRVALRVVLVLAGLGILGGLAICVARRPSLDCGSYTLRAATRMRTGLQRAERLAFADGERLLAVTCPRYNRVVLTRIVEETLTPWKEIALEGRPVALWPTSDRLYVLERPIADAHHVEAGWCEAFDFAGKPVGSRIRVGFDPDDLIVTADGRWGLVLTSGNAEGESQRPDPALIVIDLAASRDEPKVRARLVFDRKGDDPVRLALAPDERRAAVSLIGSDTIAWIDLSDRERPRIIGRSDLAMPGALTFNAHGHLIAASSAPGLWLLTGAGIAPKPLPMDGAGGDVIALDILQGHVACTVPQDSSLEVLDPDASRRLGRLPIRGTANLGTTRPIGLAFAPRRGLLAVANRQGGSVHLLSVERKTVAAQDQRAVASAGSALNRK
jgi:glycerol-3-phosphate acyltransferase PlsY